MPSEVERTTAKRVLAVTAISVRWLQQFCCTPEARSSSVNAKYSGTLREHMVRVIHLMGHELLNAQDEPIVFRQLQDVISQFPFFGSLGLQLSRF